MNIKWIIYFGLLNCLYAGNLYLNFGLTPFRQSEVAYKDLYEDINGGVGLVVGMEYGFETKKIEYGLGASLNTPIKYDGLLYNGHYAVYPIYLWGKYYLVEDKFYFKNKIGIGINYKLNPVNPTIFNNESDVGAYLSFGIGYKINKKFGLELSYEVSQFRNNGNKLSFDDSKFFKEGATDLISLSLIYKLGREESYNKTLKKEIGKDNKIEKEKNINEKKEEVKNQGLESIKTTEKLNEEIKLKNKELVKIKEEVKNQELESIKTIEKLSEEIELKNKELVEIKEELNLKKFEQKDTFNSNFKEIFIFSVGGFKAYETDLTKEMKEEIMDYMKNYKYPYGEIVIESYTDNSGDFETNEELRKERSIKLLEYIESLDFLKNFSIKLRVLKNEKFLRNNKTKKNREQNRRFLIFITNTTPE